MWSVRFLSDKWFSIYKHILIDQLGEDQNDKKSLEPTSWPTAGVGAKCSWWPRCNFERETSKLKYNPCMICVNCLNNFHMIVVYLMCILKRETSRCIGGQLFRGLQGPEVAFEYFSVWLTQSDVSRWEFFFHI